jgi:YidC/Oxa1 family membrane protein insertase
VDNRRLLIAALLSMAVLFVWSVLFPPPESVRPTPPVESITAPPAAMAEPDREPSPPVAGAESAPPAAPIAAAGESTSVLENDLARAEFTNRGAQLLSFTLKDKLEEDDSPLELVQRRSWTPSPFALVAATGEAHPLDAALFASERGPLELRFEYRGPEGAASKVFRLLPDGRLDFEIEVAGDPRDWAVLLGPDIRSRTAEGLESRFNRRAAVWSAAGEVARLEAGKDEALRLPGTGLDWIGIEDTYFLAAVVPSSRVAEARVEPVLLVPSGESTFVFDARPLAAGAELAADEKKLPRSIRVLLLPAAERLEGTSYWGAKQFDRLASFPWGLERTVRWGWLGFLSRPLLVGLQWIQSHLTPNYGWSIVLLTTALKILLLPLSLASFKSMRKMQKLNPKMQAIRERYRPKLRDKQGRFNPEIQRQMNEEIMGLYRQEGVNPAGGCLPILVQLPIFFAFYQLLSTAVELWHSPWVGWIHDLTAPDPYWVLPIVMGLSQIAQQKMTPAPPDPVQKRLMQAMPIVFTVFSLGFPAGLVLYWLTNNVLSIAQQGIYNSIRERAEHAEAPAAVGPAAKRAKKKKG